MADLTCVIMAAARSAWAAMSVKVMDLGGFTFIVAFNGISRIVRIFVRRWQLVDALPLRPGVGFRSNFQANGFREVQTLEDLQSL
jgi:hypothetical protein